MADVVNQISDLLKEEKWTRASIQEFSASTFEKYDEIIETIMDQNVVSEVEDILAEFISENPNSISALYFISRLFSKTGAYDPVYAERLIYVFKEHGKKNIVKKLCEKYLDDNTYKKILAEYIKILEEEKTAQDIIVPYWERLIKIDYSETQISHKLGSYFEKEEEFDKAIYYYKKELEFGINKKQEESLIELWNKLLELTKNDYFYFVDQIEKVDPKRAGLKIDLGIALVDYCEVAENWQGVIDSVKVVYRLISSKNRSEEKSELRKKLIESYRKVYKDNTNFESVLKRSQLNQSWKNMYVAIEVFEKYIPFDIGNYVYHLKAGMGYIKDIKDDFLIIDFDVKANHRMKIDMAIKSLKILNDDHILVIARNNKKMLNNLLQKDQGTLIKKVLKAVGSIGTSTKMKKYLVDHKIIEAKKWSSIWNSAKNKLKNDPLFSKSLEKNNEYILRDKPISFEDSLFEEFKAYSDVVEKAKVVRHYLQEDGNRNHENFKDMLKYFQNLTDSNLDVSANFVIAYFFLKELKTLYPALDISFPYSEKELFENLADTDKFCFKINDNYFEKQYFNSLQKYYENWKDVIAEYLSQYPSKYALTVLLNKNENSILKDIVRDIIRTYRDKANVFLWFCKNLFFKEDVDLKDYEIDKAEVVLMLVNLLDYVNKAIIQKIDLSANRKIYNQIIDLLFKDNELENVFFDLSDPEYGLKIAKLFFRIKDLKSEYVLEFQVILSKTFPEILSQLGVGSTETEEDVFYTTEKSIISKEEYLKEIVQEQIPKTKQDMVAAREKGDLRENSEYHAAREKLQNLNEEAAKLQRDINKAVPIDFDKIDNTKVNIGNKVKLLVKEDKKEIEYAILGRWDVDLSKNIISYETTIGQLIMNKKIDEEVVNKQDGKTLKVLNINKAN